MPSTKQHLVEILGPSSDQNFAARFLQSLKSCDKVKGACGFYTGWGNNTDILNTLKAKLSLPDSFIVVDPSGPSVKHLKDLLKMSDDLSAEGHHKRIWLYVGKNPSSSDSPGSSLMHAKTWQFRFPDGKYEVWIGSGNATAAALTTNIECWAILSMPKNSQQRIMYRDLLDQLRDNRRSEAECLCRPITQDLVSFFAQDELHEVFELSFASGVYEMLCERGRGNSKGRRIVLELNEQFRASVLQYGKIGLGDCGSGKPRLALMVISRSGEGSRSVAALRQTDNDVLFGTLGRDINDITLQRERLSTTMLKNPIELLVIHEFSKNPVAPVVSSRMVWKTIKRHNMSVKTPTPHTDQNATLKKPKALHMVRVDGSEWTDLEKANHLKRSL